MNTTQVEAFLAVADTLSFARAAERLHVTQPAVTQQIKSLEAELGATLFARTTRRVRLTDEGRAFLADAEAIMAATRRALARYRSGDAAVALVRLSVGCRSFAHSIFLSDVFREMAASEPHLHPDLLVIPHDHLHQLLEDGEVDLVLDFEGMGHRGEEFTPLSEVPFACVCPAGHRLAGRERVWPADLEGEALATSKPNYVPERFRDDLRRLLASRPEAKRYVCDSVEAASIVVHAGLAVSVQPLLSIPPEMEFSCVPFGDVEPVTFGAYTWGASRAALIERFCELARKALASHEGGGFGVSRDRPSAA